ncbi:unnamed protein product [Protopolystoma xenopodis]|uniref:Uncharacterized protein n=1 Tax=Protopolystoma xenopodis TaxID=117903 RepID=A0A3S5CS82_9PLAT|nr:unnamed protein product [Protopolystoma xenopodis]
MLEELDSCVREYSAYLVEELAYREELDFEQEQKDIFMARLDELHSRLDRRHRRASMPCNHILDAISFKKAHFSPIANQNFLFLPNISDNYEKDNVPPVVSGSSVHTAAQAAVNVASAAASAMRRKLRMSRSTEDASRDIAKLSAGDSGHRISGFQESDPEALELIDHTHQLTEDEMLLSEEHHCSISSGVTRPSRAISFLSGPPMFILFNSY